MGTKEEHKGEKLMKYEKTQEALGRLTPEQFRVTQESGTERPE